MDEKNLEVLRQLKSAMELEKPSSRPKKAHVPGQGFSEESEEVFRELARQKFSRPADQKYNPPIPKKTKPPRQEAKRICAECRSEHSATPDSHKKGNWLCRNCRSTRQDKGYKGNNSKTKGRDNSCESAGRIQSSTTTFRGVEVSHRHYKALVDACSSFSNKDKLLKLEALAFYLEKAPNDKGAMNTFIRISSSEDTDRPARARQKAKNRTATRRESGAQPFSGMIYGECEGCKEKLLILPGRKNGDPVLCGKCKDSRSGANKRITRVDREQIHAISGFGKIRCRILPGSYGSGRRS